MPATHDSSEPTPVPGTDETQDRESPNKETDDPDTTATVSEPPPVLQPVPPSPVPQHRIYGKREAAVVHERSVRPRIELPEEEELFCVQSAADVREQVQEHVSDHGVEGIGAYTVFANSVGESLKTTSKDDSHLHRVSDNQGVELTFDVSWNDLEKCQAKLNSSRNLIASTIRKSAEVTLRQLDQKGRKEFAKSAEVQSWLRYEAVTAALRSQHHHRDIMKMRWVLRYKESGRHLLHLVVEEVCSSWPPLTIGSQLKRGTSRTRFFRERLTTRHMVNSPQSQFLSCASVKTKLLCSRRRATV